VAALDRSSRSPLAHRGLSTTEVASEHEANSNPLRSNNPEFNRSIQLRSGKDGIGSGGEFDQQNAKRPRSPIKKIEGVLKFTVCAIS